jgi:hypothetical protein
MSRPKNSTFNRPIVKPKRRRPPPPPTDEIEDTGMTSEQLTEHQRQLKRDYLARQNRRA